MNKTELYRFVQGSQVWTHTSGDTEVTYNSELYTPIGLGRGNIDSRNELSKANLEVRVDLQSALGQYLLTSFLEQIVGLTIFSQDGFSTDTIWKGRLSNKRPVSPQMRLIFESVFTSLRRPGLRLRYQRPCPHVLYGRGCNLNPEDFAVPGILDGISGVTVIVPEAAGFDDGWFLGGMIKANSDGSFRYILDHVGSTLTLLRPYERLLLDKSTEGWGMNYGNQYGGTAVTLYPGCDRMLTTCDDKFDNLENNGSFPYIPVKNPFSGSSVV